MCPKLKIKIPEQPHALNKFHRQPWKRLANWFGSYFNTFQHKANHKFLKSFRLACFHKIIPGLHNNTNLQIRKLEVSLYDFIKYKGREKGTLSLNGLMWLITQLILIYIAPLKETRNSYFCVTPKNQALHKCELLSFK